MLKTNQTLRVLLLNHTGWLFVLLITILAATKAGGLDVHSSASSAGPTTFTETVEWTWAEKPKQIDPRLPNVLFVGDSIARGYYPKVVSLLQGRANCFLFATSASSGDRRLPKQLSDYFTFQPTQFAVIHFNNGMHGWDYSEAAYAAGLPLMISVLHDHQRRTQLMWASTTPVHAPDGGATNSRIDARNALAEQIMTKNNIPVDDQNSFMRAHDDLHDGNIHYTVDGSNLQAQQIVREISKLLPHK